MKRVVTFLGLFLIGASANGANGQKTDGIAVPDWSRASTTLASPATTVKSIKIDNFIAYNNGVAVDNSTGLMWMRCSLGQVWNGKTCINNSKTVTWHKAFQAVKEINGAKFGGYNDWRLPSVVELKSLIHCSNNVIPLNDDDDVFNDGCQGDFTQPTLNTKVFPNTIPYWYWTSSSVHDFDPHTTAWNVNFRGGYATWSMGNKDKYNRVRFVRKK